MLCKNNNLLKNKLMLWKFNTMMTKTIDQN